MTRELLITTSWDDGHPLDLRVADMLSKHGLSGTFYVPFETGHPVVSKQQVRDLAQDFEIGAHTVHHVELPMVPDLVAKAEIRESKQRLEQITGRGCKTFCFPKGRFRKNHLQMIRELGFHGVRTVELLSLDPPIGVNGLALIPTTVQAHSHKMSAYVRNCFSRLQPTNLRNLFKLRGYKTWESIAARLLQRASERGGVFHLWGHSWEVDATGQWDALARTLALMGQIARRVGSVTNSEVCRYAN